MDQAAHQCTASPSGAPRRARGVRHREQVADATASWISDELESAVVAAGGAAAAMRTRSEWSKHPQGRAVSAEPLMAHERVSGGPVGASRWVGTSDRPLLGVRVLDLTRVLAGPVATRLLAGCGADVLRIDPPGWDEPAIAPEMTLGKHCARLDLRTPPGRDHLLTLLGSADIVVHGYRSDALEGLGLGAEVRAECRPGLVDVSLDAYGWTGPWRTRRGFDSLVQMSTGIADVGRRAAGVDLPVPLPVQALDHATGYLLAAAAITGLTQRLADGSGSRWRTSLARVASLLVEAGQGWAPGDRRPSRDGVAGRTGRTDALGRGSADPSAPGRRRSTAPLESTGAASRLGPGCLGGVSAVPVDDNRTMDSPEQDGRVRTCADR